MYYFMGDLNIIVINDAIFFSIDGEKSILDRNKKLTISDKRETSITKYVKDDGNNTYYSTSFPIGCIDFLTIRKPQSAVGKKIRNAYSKCKTQELGLSKFLAYCTEERLSEDELLSMYTDIANGFDYKKATIRAAQKFNTDDYKSIPQRVVRAELKAMLAERSSKQAKAYQTFEDKEM